MNLKDTAQVNISTTAFKETLINFLVPLICLVITTLVGLLWIMPALRNLPAKQQELAEAQKLDNQLTTKKAHLEKLLDFRNVVAEDSDLFDKVLSSEAKVPELLAQINLIAVENGLSVTKLNYSFSSKVAKASTETPSANLYETVEVSLGSTGTYSQLKAFLESLENAARLITVEDVRYTADEDSAALNINFLLSSPYLFVESSAVTDEAVTLDITDKSFTNLINVLKDLRFYEVTADDMPEIAKEESEPSEEIEVVEGEESSE